jgi:hypothetical protein
VPLIRFPVSCASPDGWPPAVSSILEPCAESTTNRPASLFPFSTRENYGELDDYLQEYEDGRLTAEAMLSQPSTIVSSRVGLRRGASFRRIVQTARGCESRDL